MTDVHRRGRLRPPADAPDRGEIVEPLSSTPGFRVEQILSGRLTGPVRYQQDHDEWVVVLAGGAVLEVDGDQVTLSAGEWVMLTNGVPHVLVSTQPGTSWLAVRGGSPA